MAEGLRNGARRIAIIGLSLPIRLYRFCLSPLLPPACRFEPSCSAYALEALAKHGPIKGSWLTLKRLSRCHPISWLGGRSGFDPVPRA
jgi:putative membrane protein insertion efficiency factor